MKSCCCKHCGDINPENFYGGTYAKKSICKKCKTKISQVQYRINKGEVDKNDPVIMFATDQGIEIDHEKVEENKKMEKNKRELRKKNKNNKVEDTDTIEKINNFEIELELIQKNHEEDNKWFDDKIKSSNVEITNLKEDYTQLKEENLQIKDDYTQLKEDYFQLKGDHSQLKQENKQLKEEHKLLKEHVSVLSNKFEMLEKLLEKDLKLTKENLNIICSPKANPIPIRIERTPSPVTINSNKSLRQPLVRQTVRQPLRSQPRGIDPAILYKELKVLNEELEDIYSEYSIFKIRSGHGDDAELIENDHDYELHKRYTKRIGDKRNEILSKGGRITVNPKEILKENQRIIDEEKKIDY
jgi:cell division protein FtsB